MEELMAVSLLTGLAVSLLTGYGQTATLQALYGTTAAKRVIDPASGRKYF